MVHVQQMINVTVKELVSTINVREKQDQIKVYIILLTKPTEVQNVQK